jgi:hypothetical protein
MHRWYGKAEYLLWWARAQHFPVLATTGTAASQGVLGRPGTVVLFGGEEEPFNAFSGGRFTVGYWCDPCQNWGIESSTFFLGQQSVKFAANSNQFPILTRPFLDVNNGVESGQAVGQPGVNSGSIVINPPSRLWGTELNLRCNKCGDCCCGSRFDCLLGIRYLNLDERVRITETVQVSPTTTATLPPGVMPGDQALVVDDFHTRNQFVGGQVGFDWEKRWNPWVLDLRMKLALGGTHQQIDINGFQHVVHPNGTQQAFVGGLLALPSNSGHFSRDRFSVVPEVGISLGYQITDCLTLTIGYDFLYWSNVVRPADQIDRVLDISQIPNFNVTPPPTAPQRRPIVPFRETGYWAQGLHFGLECKY